MNDQTIDAEPTTALIVIPASSLPTLVEADKSDIIGRLRAELAGYIPDASTEDGRAEIGTKARKVGVAKADFIRLAMGLKADHQATIKSINTELKLIEDDCDAIRDGILAPRTEYLNRQKAIVTANEAQIATMEALTDGLADLSSADIKARYQSINSEFEWVPEFIQRASRVQNGVIAQLQVAHQAAKEREAEAEQQRISAHKIALADMDEAANVPEGASAEVVRTAIRDFIDRPRREWEEFEATAASLNESCLDHLHTCLNEAVDIETAARRVHEEALASAAAAEATRLAEIEAEHRRQKDAEAAQAMLDAAAERERIAKELAERLAVAAENSRVTAHRSALAVMAKLAEPLTPPDPLEVIRAKSVQLQDIYENRQWDEFSEDADKQLLASGKVLADALKNAIELASKAEDARKEAQRARDETARLAQEEASQANLKAAIEAERKRVADEKVAEERALAERMKRRKHVEKINRELLDDIINALSSDGEMSVQLAEDIGKVIVEAMQNGALRHVGIQY